jgi:hypothetical protein
MISAHPTGFGITFLLIAVLAHFASQRFHRLNSQQFWSCWFALKVEANDILMFELLFAIKWVVIGLLISTILEAASCVADLQEFFRDEQRSLLVMCPALLRGPTWPLALMDSASDRGLISWPGLERHWGDQVSLDPSGDRLAITCFHSRKRPGLAGHAATHACR